MRIDDDVVLRAEIGLILHVLVADVLVRNAIGVQRGAHPPFVLRPGPAVQIQDARDVEVVRLDRRRGSDCKPGQTELHQGRFKFGTISIGNNESAGRKLVAARLERLFGGLHLDVFELETERR